MMKRTDLIGCVPEMAALHLKLLREKSPEWRLQRTIRACQELTWLHRQAREWQRNASEPRPESE
ncbi:MAG: hypothetical protein SFX74_08840 [Fimbriimonadaceae bacterium]|nr:hypothetical protein [Fimbriimonadaceae bacterium]